MKLLAYFLIASHCDKRIVYSISFQSYNNLLKGVLLLKYQVSHRKPIVLISFKIVKSKTFRSYLLYE